MARDVMRRIDVIMASASDEAERADLYRHLRREIEEAERSTGLAKRELKMPGASGIRLKGALKYLLRMAGLAR